MGKEVYWWEVHLSLQTSQYKVTIVTETKEDGEKLRDLLLKDRIFSSKEVPPIEEKKKKIPKNTRLLIFVSPNLNDLKDFLLNNSDIPLILILPEITHQTLAFLTHKQENSEEFQPLHVVGIFKKENLVNENRFDLEDAGNFLRVIKHTLRSQIPESTENPQDRVNFLVKPINWKITIQSEKKVEPLLTLFLDEPMRNFIYRLQHALHQMKEGYKHIFEQGKWKDILPLTKSPEAGQKWLSEVDQWFHKFVPEEKASPKIRNLDPYFRPDSIPPFQPAHILLEGETGTGKSFLRHLMGTFLNIPQTRVAYINATTLSRQLLEVQLFGSVRGAFTDAQTKPGVLLTHAFGLIFLDEIGDVDKDVQPKLLQYLEDFQFSPEGLTGITFFSPTYFVAATNRDLRRMIGKGEFREDLYFRFRTRLRVPALRERKADLKILISYLLQSPHINPGQFVKYISYRAIQTLLDYDFRKGNFREMENILSEAVAIAQSEKSPTLLEKHIHKALYKTIL